MLMAASRAGAGEPSRYRVELIVLRHLDASAAPRPEPVLQDFSAAVDLVPRATDEAGQEDGQEDVSTATLPATNDSAAAVAGPAPGDAAQAGFPPEPPPLVWVETPGDTMQEAWRRLRQSANFRPELYFSWEQADVESSPQIRVHDGQIIHEQDPWAEQRAALTTQTAPAGIAVEEGALPEPLRYYHIDGTARLRRSRFLHVELDLQWREPAATGEAAAPAASDPDTVLASEPPPEATLHRIRQSRAVRTDEVQYFDGPFIGVLVLVTRIGPAAEPTDPTTAQP